MPAADPPSGPERPRSPGMVPDRPPTPRPNTPNSVNRGNDSGSQPETEFGQRDRPTDDHETPLALPHLGEKIDEFRLLESIGAGGMGAVFRAVDVGLDRQVALKILPPEQAIDPEVVRRYHQEGRAAARLDHENIARVYTIGDDGRYHYIAFEYIEGTTIRHKVTQDGPLSIRDAVHYTLQITQALVHAAEREVVHRDIKPSNIIVTPEGRAKLVDMGLARQFERRSEADLTQTGMTLGTFDYISPEQAQDPRDVDIRGDLYSLGCTLFHMLSGRPPFAGGTVLQKLLQHREETPPDIRKLNPNVPDSLAAIVVKLLVKDRDHRYQTPEHLARDLSRVAARRAIASKRPRSTPNWARHLFWGGPGLTFLVVLGGLVWWGDGPTRPGLGLRAGLPRMGAPGDRELIPFVPGPVFGGPVGTGIAAQPLPAPPLSEIRSREIAVSPTDDLTKILADAPPKSSILLVESGPYELRSNHLIFLDHRDLTLRADRDVRPVIRLALDAAPPVVPAPSTPRTALIDIKGGHVTFEGIDFLLDAALFEAALGGVDRHAPASNRVLSALAVEDAEVIIRRCSFRRVGGGNSATSPAAGFRVAAIRLTGSVRTSATRGDGLSASLVADATDFDAHQIGLLAVGSVDVSLRDVAFGPSSLDQAAIWADNPEPSATPAEFRLEHVSALLGAGPMFRFVGASPRVLTRHSAFGPVATPTETSPATLVAIDIPDRLDWRGADNLYARVGVFLRAVGNRSQASLRNFASWADDPSTFRESASINSDGPLWERLPLTSQNLVSPPESPRSFRLILPRVVTHHPGARWGPLGPLQAPTGLTAAGTPNRTVVTEPAPGPAPAPPLTPISRRPASRPEPRPEPVEELPSGLEPMPMPPPDPESSPVPPDLTTSGKQAPDVSPSQPTGPVAPEPVLIRTTAQFVSALKRDEPGVRTLVIAAGADLDLPAGRIFGPALWTIRAERGSTRPRLRFQAAASAADATDPAGGWSAWMVIRSGGLRLEGVDLILPATARTPAVIPTTADPAASARPRAAFAIRAGAAELVLDNTTVTIEGGTTRTALVAVLPGDDPIFAGPFGSLLGGPLRALVTTEARVRFHDCLLRSSGDLIDVAPGRSVDLDIDNSVVATGGVLLHGQGREEGQTPSPLRLALRRVATQLAGGLVHLTSDRDHPTLPVATIYSSDTILALVHPSHPLIQVDGQGELSDLRDRVEWHGRSVAYHRVTTYRRDATSRPGVTSARTFDRDSWEAALGAKDEGAFRGDLDFRTNLDPTRPAWQIQPTDLRLDPTSPAAEAAIGPDLLHIPNAPRD